MNTSTKFQLCPQYSFWGVDFWIFFANLAFWLPWQPIQLRGLDKKYMFVEHLTQQTFLKNFRQNICYEIAINTNFHFSHYKPMEISSCHNNQSTTCQSRLLYSQFSCGPDFYFNEIVPWLNLWNHNGKYYICLINLLRDSLNLDLLSPWNS